MKFAGDAMIICYPSASHEPAGDSGAAGNDDVLATVARRAAQGAMDIKAQLQGIELAEEVRFSVKLGLGVGRASILHVGGAFRRLEYVICGEALQQVGFF